METEGMGAPAERPMAPAPGGSTAAPAATSGTASASPRPTPEKPKADGASHAEVLDGRYHRLGKRTLWIFVLARIHTSIIILLLTLLAFSLQGQPFVATFMKGILQPYLATASWVLLVLFLVVFGLTYFFSWLVYMNYKFLIGEDSLRIQRGILSKEEIAIPYRQIQDVDIERSLYYRTMGLSRLIILTAGHEDEKGDESEGIMPAMDWHLADWMQGELLRRTEIQRVVEVPAAAGG